MVRILRKREQLPKVIREIVQTYANSELRLHHLRETPLPNEDVVVEILGKLRTVLFPGYFGKEHVNEISIEFYVGELVYEIYEELTDEVYKAFRQECEHQVGPPDAAEGEGEQGGAEEGDGGAADEGGVEGDNQGAAVEVVPTVITSATVWKPYHRYPFWQ